ncbi:hypothetical protein KEM48_005148 [Puccinia striiformis f. sp. tritici PST-130]|nr:hypothetical protein H4Q26_005006 [Puccinia striiformis f. sp. tritici PST-130]KAI9616730.1 hypothetical protein KEM48_005148 [Puccinia striiformis f. sp. tritici PST-130]
MDHILVPVWIPQRPLHPASRAKFAMEKQELNVQHEEQIKSLKTRHETQLVELKLKHEEISVASLTELD